MFVIAGELVGNIQQILAGQNLLAVVIHQLQIKSGGGRRIAFGDAPANLFTKILGFFIFLLLGGAFDL